MSGSLAKSHSCAFYINSCFVWPTLVSTSIICISMSCSETSGQYLVSFSVSLECLLTLICSPVTIVTTQNGRIRLWKNYIIPFWRFNALAPNVPLIAPYSRLCWHCSLSPFLEKQIKVKKLITWGYQCISIWNEQCIVLHCLHPP